MHLTPASAEHMAVVIRTRFAITRHSGTGKTYLAAADGNGTCAGALSTRYRLAYGHFRMSRMVCGIGKVVCAHGAHGATAIDVVHDMASVYQHGSVTTHDTGIEVEVCLPISSCIGVRAATRAIDIATIGIASPFIFYTSHCYFFS